MTIKRVLENKGSEVATIAPDAPLGELIDRLAELRIGALVVSSDGETIEGIVSERDIVRALRTGALDALRESRLIHLERVHVRDIMTAEVTTAEPGTPIDEVMAIMTASRIRHIPVVVEERIVGIVSIGDIVKARIDHLEWERSNLVDYLTTGR